MLCIQPQGDRRVTDQDEFDRQVAAHFRWNFGANVMDLAFYALAMSFVSQTTVMPLLVSRLTSSKLAIGLIPAIFSLGFLLPQLLMASYTERLRFKRPFVVAISGPGERLPYLLIGLAVWWLAGPQPALALIVFYLLLAVTASSAGIATPAWSDLIAKVIPVHRRGLYAGTANGLGALMGVAGAWLSGLILATVAFPDNFALCFMLAAAAQVFSWAALALNREPAGIVVKARVSQRDYFRQLPRLLQADRNYRRFLVSRAIAALGSMAGGFFMVYGFERFAFGGREVGIATAILAGSQAVVNPLWGLLGDRSGHKIVLACGAFCTLLATAAVLLAPSAPAFFVAFAFLGAALAADSVSSLNIAMEFGSVENRPTYIGLTNTLLAPTRTLAPIIGGALATVAGYPPMFGLAMVLAGAGGLLLATWVREPRSGAEGRLRIAG